MRAALACIVVLLCAVGCKDPKKSGFFSGPIAPSIEGDWNGLFQMGTSTPTMHMGLDQQNINVIGLYQAPALSAAVIGDQGTVRGLTTGNSFNLRLEATAPPGCVAKIDMNGYNDGAELSFNFSGVDCSSAAVSGQGYGTRPF